MLSPHSRRFNKLMKRERSAMLKGKGAFRAAKQQLEDESAEEFYVHYKKRKKPQRKKYIPSTDALIADWADDTATMLYNRKQRRKRDIQ